MPDVWEVVNSIDLSAKKAVGRVEVINIDSRDIMLLRGWDTMKTKCPECGRMVRHYPNGRLVYHKKNPPNPGKYDPCTAFSKRIAI